MRKPVLLLSTVVVLAAPLPASAQVNACTRPAQLRSPFAFVTVNGQCTDLSAFIITQTKGWSLNTQATLAGSIVNVSAIFNSDPFITVGGTTTNLNPGATTYAFLFGTPIVPDIYSLAISSVQLMATSPQGTTTVASNGTYPAFISGYGTLGLAATNLGVDAGAGSCVATGVLASTACGPYDGSASFAPAFYDNLEALVTYTQDNPLSTASFNGNVTIDAVTTDAVTATPEPSSLALLGSGLLLLAGYASRRRREV